MIAEGMAQHLLSRIEVAANDCWLWQGPLNLGYGQGCYEGRTYLAHRRAYETFVGPIQPGLQIDHVCHSTDNSCVGGLGCLHRRCINPQHLEPVTIRTNVLRGVGRSAVNARKQRCPNGHEYSHTYKGHRLCRPCMNAAQTRYLARKREASC